MSELLTKFARARHPEAFPSEVWLTNVSTVADYQRIGYAGKRIVQPPLDMAGCAIPGMFGAVVVPAAEYQEKCGLPAEVGLGEGAP